MKVKADQTGRMIFQTRYEWEDYGIPNQGLSQTQSKSTDKDPKDAKAVTGKPVLINNHENTACQQLADVEESKKQALKIYTTPVTPKKEQFVTARSIMNKSDNFQEKISPRSTASNRFRYQNCWDLQSKVIAKRI